MIILCIFLLRLILVQPVGEAVDAVAIQTAQQAVTGAASFWHTRAPFPIEIGVVETTTLTTTADPYTDSIAWAAGMGNPSHTTIIVVDNRQSHRLLLNGRAGGWAWDGVVVATLHQPVGVNALPAIIAHELGHVLFGLDDLYDTPGTCALPDIMCSWVTAYNVPTIGCTSLARLGYPCKRVLLPIFRG